MKSARVTRADFPSFEKKPLNPNLCEPRKVNFQFNNIPKLWLNNSSVLTHFFNAINLFLPAFEAFMVRVMKKQLFCIRNTGIELPVRGFIKQEATHGQTHQKYNNILESQGYKFKTALKIVDFLFTEVLEKYFSSKMSLALIAGFENIATILSFIALKSNMLAGADTTMRSLWEWHLAEEIEHSGVAFKFLNNVDNRYWVRILGGLLGGIMVIGAIVLGMVLLISQDKNVTHQKTFDDLKKLLFTEYKFVPLTWSGLLPYFQLKFYPESEDMYLYAEKVFSN
jgi:hypothetical protein